MSSTLVWVAREETVQADVQLGFNRLQRIVELGVLFIEHNHRVSRRNY
jgi:hypothetical protein